METFRFNGSVVERLNEKGEWAEFVRLPDEVDRSLELPNGMTIFRTRVVSDKTNNRNVFGVDSNGRIIWQIEKAASAPDPFYPNVPNPYCAIIWENNVLCACTSFGADYTVDLKTGKVSFLRFQK